MFAGNEVRQARETPFHSANAFASPICIPCPKENHVSLPSNVFFCVYIPFFMHPKFGKKIFFSYFFFKTFFL